MCSFDILLTVAVAHFFLCFTKLLLNCVINQRIWELNKDGVTENKIHLRLSPLKQKDTQYSDTDAFIA